MSRDATPTNLARTDATSNASRINVGRSCPLALEDLALWHWPSSVNLATHSLLQYGQFINLCMVGANRGNIHIVVVVAAGGVVFVVLCLLLFLLAFRVPVWFTSLVHVKGRCLFYTRPWRNSLNHLESSSQITSKITIACCLVKPILFVSGQSPKSHLC